MHLVQQLLGRAIAVLGLVACIGCTPVDGPSFGRFQEDVDAIETQLGVDFTVLSAPSDGGCADVHYIAYANNDGLDLEAWEIRPDLIPEKAVPGDVYQSDGQYLILDEGLVVYSEGECGFSAASSYLYPMETSLGYSRNNVPEIAPQRWEHSSEDWNIEAISASVQTQGRGSTFFHVELSMTKLSDGDTRVPLFYDGCDTRIRATDFDQHRLGARLDSGTVLRGVLSSSDYSCDFGDVIYMKMSVDAESVPVEIFFE